MSLLVERRAGWGARVRGQLRGSRAHAPERIRKERVSCESAKLQTDVALRVSQPWSGSVRPRACGHRTGDQTWASRSADAPGTRSSTNARPGPPSPTPRPLSSLPHADPFRVTPHHEPCPSHLPPASGPTRVVPECPASPSQPSARTRLLHLLLCGPARLDPPHAPPAAESGQAESTDEARLGPALCTLAPLRPARLHTLALRTP